MAKILILGGGFGGAYAALELEKKLKPREAHEITIVCRENFLLFTPMLHEVATGDVSITDIVCPLRQLLRHCEFLQGNVTAIDLEKKTVAVTHCSGAEIDNLPYDYLLIALGSQSNYFGLPGIEGASVSMKSLEDAICLRNKMIASLEEAEFDAKIGRKPLLTYVVAGAGFAGVETAASLNDFIREAIRYYPSLHENMVRVMLVDLISLPLPELGEELGKYAAQEMAKQKIELKMSTKITGFSERGLEFADGSFIRPVVLVWTAGVTPSQILKTLPCKLDRNKIVANEFLEVPDYAGVWALGDCAMIMDPSTGKPYPPTAQHACRQGTVAGHNIAVAVSGSGHKTAFSYKAIGALAALGRRAGVAKIFAFRFSGMLAWLMWRTIYLMKLPQFERRLRVAFHWVLDLAFPKDYVQFQTLAAPLPQDDQAVSVSAEEPASQGPQHLLSVD